MSCCHRSDDDNVDVSDFLAVADGPDWSNINPDLLEYIQKKLPLPDTFRCRFVCCHWRSTTKAHILSKSLTYRPPMLMLNWKFKNLYGDEDYSEAGDDSGLLFLNLASAPSRAERSSKKKRIITMDRSEWRHYPIGSFSGGWLLCIDNLDGRIVMFNPSSNGTSTYLRLPRIKYPFSSKSVIKVVFWGNPILGADGINNYGMVITCGYEIYYARGGDSEFTKLESSLTCHRRIHDMICINDIVYAVSRYGYIEAWDCSSSMTRPKKILSFPPEMPQRDRSLHPCMVYLVEYEGEMLFVSGFFYIGFNGSHSGAKWDPRRLFGVYKLDLVLLRWVAVESLGDMVLILLCRNQAIALSTREFPNYESNSIYYEDEKRYINIFNLEEGSWKKADE